MSTVRELLHKLADHYYMMGQQLDFDHLLAERCSGARLMCQTLLSILPKAVLDASSSIMETEGHTRMIEIPEKMYVVTSLRLPPDGHETKYYVQEVSPTSLQHLLQLHELHGHVFFSEETAKAVCEGKKAK